MVSEHCSSRDPRQHWKCEQGGCECRCHETVVYDLRDGTATVKKIIRRKRRLSPRGNWMVVTYENNEISWAQWIQTWAGVQAHKRNQERHFSLMAAVHKDFNGRVIVIDIERVIDMGATEGANEIADLERLINLE